MPITPLLLSFDAFLDGYSALVKLLEIMFDPSAALSSRHTLYCLVYPHHTQLIYIFALCLTYMCGALTPKHSHVIQTRLISSYYLVCVWGGSIGLHISMSAAVMIAPHQ
ncbi:uncharacterized protein PHALS_13553 [Plasmopara halstedii]|uniref:Uncharacterized protein n=1 Tax=Plasmopara halstedii TaxID=4781 RepID=A0A0P1AQ36_PLAHL|nr:uncharacterized protein PHALS_13553 [Plasmopara halstedii]CEG43353.1 hypothetical protein PHALS_13553 [Plasmopara halstedii]|eukprot:XP_024579722.1 hypothetical protein PHALS_13553 [Plasmopara halstedii]